MRLESQVPLSRCAMARLNLARMRTDFANRKDLGSLDRDS